MKDVLKEQRLIKTADLRANKGQLVHRGIPTNPRKITKEKYNLLLQSLDKSNLTQIRPLDVIEHMGKFIVLSGNQRLRALKELKIKEVPCNIIRDDLEPETYRQIVLQANTTYGEHDDDLLANEWDAVELHEWGYDLPSWDDQKIEQEETQGDDDVPVSAPAITVKGDLYILGEHRLLCGDSTMIDDVEKLMDGEKADISFTSPPYNAGKSELLSGNTHTGDNKYNSYNDNQTSENYVDLLVSFTKNALLNSEYLICNIQSLAGNKMALIDYMNHFKNNFIDVAIWDKGHGAPAMAENVMNSAWEYLLFISSKEKPSRAIPKANFRGTVSNIFRGNPQRNNEFSKIHAATFPIELCEWALQFTNEKNIILDLFLGSGSTLIACEKTNRKCYGMELDEKYCDVIVKRYIEFCVKNNKEAKVYRNGELISNDVFLVGWINR